MKLKFLIVLISYFAFSTQYGQHCSSLFSKIPIDKLQQLSEGIIEGKVTNSQSIWDIERKNIYTIYSIKVISYLGEKKIGNSIQLTYLGGKVNEDLEIVSSSPELNIGNEGYFFIKKANVPLANTQNLFTTVAASQGVFIKNKKDTFSNIFESFKSGSSFKKQLQQKSARSWKTNKIRPLARKSIASGSVALAAPIINNFSPSAVNAGTRETITINGANFGNSTGEVLFSNTDDGGVTFVAADISQIIAWNNTQIIVEVPYNGGTGPIQVFNNDETSTSSNSLFVDFSYANIVYDGIVFQNLLNNANGLGGVSFSYHTDFNTSPAKDRFEEAYEKWNCESSINFRFENITTIDESVDDGISIVRFDNGNELPLGTLGQVITRINGFCFTSKQARVAELDILWDDTTNWSFATGNPTPSQIDFKSMALHELGHAHQLWHVIDPSAVMHFSINVGESKFNLTSEDIAAAQFTMNQFLIGDTCATPRMTEASSCCADTVIDEEPAAQTVLQGNNAVFNVVKNLVDTYQWQINTGSGWVNLVEDATYTNTQTENLTVVNTTTSMNGDQFRCLLNRANCSDQLITNGAVLTVSNSSTDPNAFIADWDTTIAGTSTTNQITIPTNPNFTYNYTVDWGDGQIDSNLTGDITHTYATPGVKSIAIIGNFPAFYFNNTGDKDKIGEVSQWGTIAWKSFENAFYGCSNFNFNAITPPDLSLVTTLKNAFRNAISFNGVVNFWEISNITDLSGTFAGASAFNRPLANWNTGSVTTMESLFDGAKAFNEPIENWNLLTVTTTANMFKKTSAFNQTLNNWNVVNVTNMSGMFADARVFNTNINNWDVSNVTNMNDLFSNADAFNQPLDRWNVASVTNMSGTFDQAANFNQPIEVWDVRNVTDMSRMFNRADDFNQPLNDWNVSNVTNMSQMFANFFGRKAFNQPLNNWNVSNVIDMNRMFDRAVNFNQPLDNWNVSNVTNMNKMFSRATVFDQPIGNWNVGNVTDMSAMFDQAIAFNQPLNTWNISSITGNGLIDIFKRASSFNQPLDSWNVTNLNRIDRLFEDATAFNQDLSSWDISNISSMLGIFNNTAISIENYDSILVSWSAQTLKDNVRVGALGLRFCDGKEERQQLIDATSWMFDGDTEDCGIVQCTNIVNPINGDTNVPTDFILFWNPAAEATGYRISVRKIVLGLSTPVVTDLDIGPNLFYDFPTDFDPGDEVFVTITPYDTDGNTMSCGEESFITVTPWSQSTTSYKTTWDTRLANDFNNQSGPNQIEIGINTSIRAYDYSIDWGDGRFNNNVTSGITHTYATPGIYTVSITGDYPASTYGPFDDGAKLLTMEQWGDNQWQSMQSAYSNCSNMTYNATDIPNLSMVTNMSRMFAQTDLFNGDISNWDVSTVTNMGGLFSQAASFNQPLNTWDVSNVTNMSGMFVTANAFNQPLDMWDVSKVTRMSTMFFGMKTFNQPLDSWNTGAVQSMARMFESNTAFNQSIGSWNVENVIDMNSMFLMATAFNQPIGNWNVSAVTQMNKMFERATGFNQNINDWNVSSVTNMQSMFKRAVSFDNPLNNWNVSNVTNMNNMFEGAANFNRTLDAWNVEKVTFMASMFRNAITFNQALENWAPSEALTMASMFDGATAFNKALENWNVSGVINMASMFRRATSFNQPLNNWNVSAVSTMASMFEGATNFSQPLNNWNVSSVTLMNSMFKNTDSFNEDITLWDVSKVTNMESMFENTAIFDQSIGSWNTDEVTNMESMFEEAILFNQPLNNWNVAKVTSMISMFKDAIVYNQPMSNWDTSRVTNMDSMFNGAIAFNQNINTWNVGRVTLMRSMFYRATSFNMPLNNWNTGNVLNMQRMFSNTSNFNRNLNSWNVGLVANISDMFNRATAFNQPLDNWNTVSVTEMDSLFENAIVFNRNINAWNMSNVISMREVFSDATAYNFPLDQWNVSNVTRMDAMFRDASSFNQDLASWNVASVTDMRFMLDRTNLSRVNYDNTLIGWSTLDLQNNVEFGTTGLLYCEAEEERDDIISTYSWNIGSDILDCPIPACTTLITPTDEDTNVPVNTNLTWEPVLYAKRYRVRVVTNPGGVVVVNNEIVLETNYSFASNFSGNENVLVTITPINDTGETIDPCTTERFKIINNPTPEVPSCTSLTSPINGSTNVALDTDISWNLVDNADGYRITVGTTSGGTEIANNEDVANKTSFTPSSPLADNSTIFVTITPYNEEGDIICTEEQFTTTELPSPPTCTMLSSPMNGDTDVELTTNLNWTASLEATSYLLNIKDSDNNTILDNANIGNTNFYDPPVDFEENTTILVTITPINDSERAIGCIEERFTTETLPVIPNCTRLSSPLNRATNVSTTTTLSWNADRDATGYILKVGTTSRGTEIVNNENVNNVTTYSFASELSENTQIFVTITPYSLAGSQTSCNEEFFTTGTKVVIPDCTTLTTPANTATNVTIDTDLSWTPVANATAYIIKVGTTTGGTDILNNENVGNITTLDLTSDLPQNQEIFVTVTPTNLAGNATGCTETSFTTETIITIPDCTTLSTPGNTATNVTIDTDLNWTPVANATAYIINIGTTKGGTDILNNENVGNITTLDLTSDLPQNQEIFVTVTPTNLAGNATGCNETSFTTETIITIPDCTTLTTPANTATNVTIDTDLSWTPVANATAYIINIGTTKGGTDILNNENVGNITTLDLTSDLPQNQEIFVTVTPTNLAGNATGCTETSFTTETIIAIPDCTTLTTPANTATNVTIDTDLNWTPIANATAYIINVGTTKGGTDILNNENVGNITTLDLTSDLPQNQEIFVTVTPTNLAGNATGCTETSFTTETRITIPDCTTLSTPANTATNVTIDTDLSWTPVANATAYIINVGTITGGTDILNNENVGNITTLDLTSDLPQNQEIFVTVTPTNLAGNATGCTETSFTTETRITIPDCTTLTTPANTATNVTIDTDLNWTPIANATAYIINVGTTKGGTDILNNENVGNITTLDLTSDLPQNQEIFVTVTPTNLAGNATGCTETSFTTETIITIPDCTTLTTPADTATNVTIDTDLNWTPVANATAYIINVGTTTGGTDILNNENVGNITTLDLTSDLPQNQEIFVTVTPTNLAGNAKECTETSFTTETIITIPDCTTLTTPADTATNVTIDTDLNWTPVANATAYIINVGTTTGGTDILNNENVGNITTLDLTSDLPQNQEIFVTVTPTNLAGNAKGCTETSFTTETIITIPDCTTLTTPADTATNVTIDTDLSWTPVANATVYIINVGTTKGGTDILNNENVGNTTTLDLTSDLPQNQEIFVTVTPTNLAGNAKGCTETSFTTVDFATIPLCTSLINPLNETTNVALNATLNWEIDASAIGYLLSVGTSSGGNDILDKENVVGLNSYTFEDSLPETTSIYVSIIPYNFIGEATACTEEFFVTTAIDDTKFGFSPDGDGINEYWHIDNIELIPNNKVFIYNRWGDLVFEANAYNNESISFRGEANRLNSLGGSTLPAGTYYFIIDVPANSPIDTLKGFLVIKR